MEQLQFRLKFYLIGLITVFALGTGGFMLLEGLSAGDALYFSIVTMSTVGYGDIHPDTAGGKIVSVFLIVGGVATFVGVVGNATELMLNRRDQIARVQKLNLVVGLFFGQMGTRLLRCFAEADRNAEEFRNGLIVSGGWSLCEFDEAARRVEEHDCSLDMKHLDLAQLREFLDARTDFLLRLLENPVLLEHGSLTEVLRAVFHLKDELDHRETLVSLPDSDLRHLGGDVRRAYLLLLREWLGYMKCLKFNYPYLFSLAARTNPFDRNASPVVEDE